ncbi:Uncharacterised protein [Yersinia kristensenii]|nr:Uncharacterised protein [Yersinia kristensenii]
MVRQHRKKNSMLPDDTLMRQSPPDTVFGTQSPAGDGQMNVGMLIKLATVGMQGHKQAYFDTEFFGPFEQSISGTGEKFIEQGPVVGKGRPEFIGHGEGNVLPFTVGENMLLLSNPLLGGLHATGAAAFAFATLAEVFGVRTVGRSAAISANAHCPGTASKHPFDDEFGPFWDDVTVFCE